MFEVYRPTWKTSMQTVILIDWVQGIFAVSKDQSVSYSYSGAYRTSVVDTAVTSALLPGVWKMFDANNELH